jgi:hypothetical protein
MAGPRRQQTKVPAERFDKLFASQLGPPLRGNRAITALEVASAVTTVVLFIGAVLQLFGSGPAWSIILVVWMMLLTTGLIALVVVQERRVARRTRYAVATEATHGAEHLIRDAEAGILNENANVSQTIPILRKAMTEVARTFTLITGSPCRACIKEVHYPGAEAVAVGADNLRHLTISTLCRDNAGGPPTPSDEREHFVSENTDFELLFMKRWKYRWYHSNDLESENPYKNSNWGDDSPHDYRSTCVWPIQKTDETDGDRHDTLGFLCVDSLDTDIFDSRFDFHVGASIADSLYPLMRLMRLANEGFVFSPPRADDEPTSSPPESTVVGDAGEGVSNE